MSIPRVEAIDRALVLLSTLGDHGSAGASLASLCAETGINKATAYRALSTLRLRGFAIQNEDGTYALGPAAAELGAGAYTPQQLAHELHPCLVALAGRLNELVHLGTLSGDSVTYLDKVEPDRAIRVWSAVGRSIPVVTSSLGRSLLAPRTLTDAQLEVYLAGQPADHRVTRTQLRALLAETQRRGYAREFEENEPGVACLGTAIVTEGRPVAALSVTTLAPTLTTEREAEVVAAMREVVPPLLPAGLELWAG